MRNWKGRFTFDSPPCLGSIWLLACSKIWISFLHKHFDNFFLIDHISFACAYKNFNVVWKICFKNCIFWEFKFCRLPSEAPSSPVYQIDLLLLFWPYYHWLLPTFSLYCSLLAYWTSFLRDLGQIPTNHGNQQFWKSFHNNWKKYIKT